MKFRYITVDADGYLWGTNDEDKAKKVSTFGFVWDVSTGEYLFGETEVRPEIPEVMNLAEIPDEWLATESAEKTL